MKSSSISLARTADSLANLSAVDSLYVAAVIACYGSTEAIRRSATSVVFFAAPAAVWGMMARHTTVRIDHHVLTFITRRAVTRFLQEWPSSDMLTVASMSMCLERCVADCQMSMNTASTAPRPLVDTRLGVLARLSTSNRMAMISSVRAQLTATQLTELSLLAEPTLFQGNSLVDESCHRERAIQHLEDALLGGAMYELGVPSSTVSVGIAA